MIGQLVLFIVGISGIFVAQELTKIPNCDSHQILVEDAKTHKFACINTTVVGVDQHE